MPRPWLGPTPAIGSASVRNSRVALALATEASYAAVGRPVEGTILSVARAAAEAAAQEAADQRRRLGHVVAAAASAARAALARTPDQLETLALRRGRDLATEGVAIEAIGGAQAVRRAVARHDGARVVGLVDAGEAGGFRRARPNGSPPRGAPPRRIGGTRTPGSRRPGRWCC